MANPSGPSQVPLRSMWFLDNVDTIPLCSVPTLVVHGTEDIQCPPPQAEAVVAASSMCEIRWVSGEGHDTIRRSAEYWQAVQNFFLKITNNMGISEGGQPS